MTDKVKAFLTPQHLAIAGVFILTGISVVKNPDIWELALAAAVASTVSISKAFRKEGGE